LRANLQGKFQGRLTAAATKAIKGQTEVCCHKAPNCKPEHVILSCIQDALKQRLKFWKNARSNRRQLDLVIWFGKLF